MRDEDKNADLTAKLVKRNNVLEIRLTLAQAFIQMLTKAYDALLHHGVIFRDLPEYHEDNAIEDADKLPIEEGRTRLMSWMKRVESAIEAAIRRKQFKKV